MDEVLYAMTKADIKILASIVNAMCANEMVLRMILKKYDAGIEESGLNGFLDQIMEVIGRRMSNDD